MAEQLFIQAGSVQQITLAGASALVITNLSPLPIQIIRSNTQPSLGTQGETIYKDQTLYFPPGASVWACAYQDTLLFIQSVLEAASPLVTASFPAGLLTSGPEDFQRLRVDDSQTGFFLGTQARAFHEISLAQGNELYIKIHLPVDAILFETGLAIDSGGVRLATIASPTFTGSWTTKAVFPKNTMSSRPQPYYAPQAQLWTGSLSGGNTVSGVEIDVLRLVTSNATSKAQTAGASPFSERGVAAGDYAYKMTNIGQGTATGTLQIWWEERP